MKADNRRNTVLLVMFFAILVLPARAVLAAQEPQIQVSGSGQGEITRPEHWITADHSKFKGLQQDFASGPEVTAVCLNCHNEAGKQVSESIHWTWLCPADPTGRMGKNGVTLNNF